MAGHSGQDQNAKTCDVKGCENEAERSISFKQVKKCSLQLKEESYRNVHLCKEHYKTYKKDTKEERSLNSIY